MKQIDMKNQTILLVDDSATNIDIMMNLLSNYDLIPALDGQTALDIVQEDDIDLILLDIVMPGLSGFDVCRKLKENEKTKHIPILFITAKSDHGSMKEGFEIGGSDYITKPFNTFELLARVKNHIELSSYRLDLEKRVQEEIAKTQAAHNLMIQKSKLADMGELINMIAHQWRQPLGSIGSILMSIDFVMQSAKYDLNNLQDSKLFIDFIKNKNSKISTTLEFLSTTIDDFRNFYKQDKEKVLTELSEPVKKTLDIVKTIMNNNGINIVVTYESNAQINIYKNEVMQVILNILKNSEDNFLIKKIDKPMITIVTKKENENYIISIEDNGGGIDTNILAKVFNPYFSTKLKKNGTGLGLYMSKTIIETHHNGNLNVYNVKDGVCFEIIIKGSN